MRVLFTSIATTFLTALVALLLVHTHEEYLYNLAREHTVMLIRSTGGGGTGFHFEKNGQNYIMTNYHICKGQKVLKVPEKGKAVVLGYSSAVDLCVLQPRFDHAGGLAFAEDYAYGEHVRVMGHGYLLPLHESIGRLESRATIELSVVEVMDPKLCPAETKPYPMFFFVACLREFDSIFTSVRIGPGNSGSPVIDIFGHVVGVVFAGHNGSGLGYIVPLEYVKLVVGEL